MNYLLFYLSHRQGTVGSIFITNKYSKKPGHFSELFNHSSGIYKYIYPS